MNEHHRIIFLKKLEEIRRCVEGDTADLILATGAIRHLLFEGRPLVHLVNGSRENQKDKEDIIFTVSSIMNGPTKGVLINWQRIYPFTVNTKKLNLMEFKKEPCLVYMFETYTVGDILDVCAHILGGIHTQPSRTPQEERIIDLFKYESEKIEHNDSLFEYITIDMEQFGFETIKDICKVVLEALAPLEAKLKA